VIIDVDVVVIEDQILNPLNSIIMLTHHTDNGKKVENEIDRIVKFLEDQYLIKKRKKRKIKSWHG
jgi:hypothetical protein